MLHRKSPEEESMLSSLIALFCLYESSLSGYGIRSKLKEWNISEYITISPATIYRSLAKLEDEGMLKSQVERNGRYPASRVYSITPAGRKRYRELIHKIAVFKMSASPVTSLIGLASYLPASQRIKLSQAWMAGAQKMQKQLQAKLDAKTGIYGKPFAEWLLLDREIYRLKFDIQWLQHYIKLLESGKA